MKQETVCRFEKLLHGDSVYPRVAKLAGRLKDQLPSLAALNKFNFIIRLISLTSIQMLFCQNKTTVSIQQMKSHLAQISVFGRM